MAHLSLYRKHRPRTFDEVVGQEHVTRTLVNAITQDTLHHAYLFTGQRGTGKTSTARILAAAVNCEQGPTPEPCGTCDQCVSIVEGRNVDVVELDMASHGGVDDARELRDRAVFAPAAARRKVYILDEVHMASTAAFNALLKVIEEPPSHVLFTMATTDPQKVLPTIMSRVQRLDLRRVPAGPLTDHLDHLGEVEDFRLDDEAAAAVVAAGDGSVRDTLSVLEQVLAFAADADARVDGLLHVTGDHVTAVLGTTPFDRVHGVVEAIADADVAAALTGIQGLLDDGHDLRRFSLDLARHLRDLLVTAAAPDVEDLVDATAEHRARLAAQSQRFGVDTLVRAVELVGEVLVEQRQGPPRLPLELAVARMATPGADGDLAALADRVARLERAVAGDVGAVPAPRSHRTPSSTGSSSPSPSSPSATTADPPVSPTPTPAAQPPGGEATTAGAASAPAEAPGEQAGSSAPAEAPGEQAGSSAPAEAPEEEAGTTGAPVPADAPAADTADATPGSTDDEVAAVSEADAPDESAGAGEDLAARARSLAATASTPPPAAPLEGRPGTTTVERDAGPPLPDGGDDLATVVERWEAILELVGDASRRAKAFYEPATPVRLGRGVLLLSYPANRRFHAEQGKGGEMAAHLAAAVEQSTGLAGVRVDVTIEDEGPRRPDVPVVSGPPDDDTAPPAQEVADVAEATADPPAVPSDPEDVDRLLRDALGAEPLADDE